MVCFLWQDGRCNRHPSPYLHSEHPQSLDFGAKRAHHQNPPHGLIWRNPNTGGNPAPPSIWGKDRGGANGGLPQTHVNKLCNYFITGNCSYGERFKFLHSWFVSDSFSLLTPLQGYQKVITGIALPSGSDKLYSGSKDETVRVWDCQSGQCVGVVTMGSEVGCMISEGPWIFIGVTNAVRALNTQMSSLDLSLNYLINYPFLENL